jgi:hypothetical protein
MTQTHSNNSSDRAKLANNNNNGVVYGIIKPSVLGTGEVEMRPAGDSFEFCSAIFPVSKVNVIHPHPSSN